MTAIEKIKPGLEKASENYAKNTALRSTIALIPYIGGSLDILFSAKGNEIIFNRINSFLDFLDEEMKLIDESKIDTSFLETQEWFDLVYKSFDEVKKTRLNEKQKLFARILAKSTYNHDDINKIELYQNILSELSPNEFKVALHLLSNIDTSESEDYKTRKEFWDNLTVEDFSKEIISDSISRLFSLGLLSERYGAILGYSGGHYIINCLLKDFLNYIMEDNQNDTTN
ncbi:MAG: hypothetical protein KKF89_03965 [Nanoarchaeota archaeon]|nr:hypothetical protein [Nanoarchaeota archaeon]